MEAYKYSCAEFVRLSELLKDEKDPDEQARLADLIAMYRLAAETFSRGPELPEKPSRYTYYKAKNNEMEAHTIVFDHVRVIKFSSEICTVICCHTNTSHHMFKGYFPLALFLDNIRMEEINDDGCIDSIPMKYYVRRDKLAKIDVNRDVECERDALLTFSFSDTFTFSIIYKNTDDSQLEKLRASLLKVPAASAW